MEKSLSLRSFDTWLEHAFDILTEGGHHKGAQIVARPTRSERRLCLMWAHYMTEREGTEPTRDELKTFREVLHEVRERDALIDLDGRQVFCKEVGRVFKF